MHFESCLALITPAKAALIGESCRGERLARLCGSLAHPPCLCGQYPNLAAVLRSRRQASKSGCALTTRIIDSIAAIITPGSISPSVHSRSGSRGVGKLSKAGSSQLADTSFDLAERSGSTILRNNRPQFGIFKISIRGPKKTDYVLPVGVVHIDTDAELRRRKTEYRNQKSGVRTWKPPSRRRRGLKDNFTTETQSTKLGTEMRRQKSECRS